MCRISGMDGKDEIMKRLKIVTPRDKARWNSDKRVTGTVYKNFS